MAIKKKTKKKIIKKAKKKTTKVNNKSRLHAVQKTTKKMVDDFLLKVNPQVQKQVDQLRTTLEKTPTSMADLKMLGIKVLERAKNLSQKLRAESSAKKQRTKK